MYLVLVPVVKNQGLVWDCAEFLTSPSSVHFQKCWCFEILHKLLIINSFYFMMDFKVKIVNCNLKLLYHT